MAPFGTGDIDYTTFFQRIGAKGYHNSMWEQDTAPGGIGQPRPVARVRAGLVRQHGRAPRLSATTAPGAAAR